MKIIFASSNKNKIKEIKELLPAYSIIGLEEFGIKKEIPETGATIKENSLIKANYVKNHLANKANLGLILSDDSGLEVEALNGEPGVYSARYAGIPKRDDLNNKKLLKALEKATNRKARFVTVITLITDEETYFFEGEILGTIAFEPRGSNGFGYDPLFIPRGYRSTFGELSSETKNSVSHRANAVKKLVDFLAKR